MQKEPNFRRSFQSSLNATPCRPDIVADMSKNRSETGSPVGLIDCKDSSGNCLKAEKPNIP